MKLTKFECEELGYKLNVITDEPEMLQDIGRTEEEINALDKKLVPGEIEFEQWEIDLLLEEAENLLDIADSNLDAGFPYRNDVRKLNVLVSKLGG